MELEQIEGTVEDIIYENPDNGYTVFEISGGGTVTVVCGIVGELHAGESVVCRGKYENHATYGRQFHAQECETDMPKDLEAVYAFLASRSLPYIGARIHGECVHSGRTTRVVDVDITNQDGANVCKATFTMFVTGVRDESAQVRI